ncbi:hypothetical protein K7472_01695 [Streptomyces sp. PTM05]|uniref:Uncharacterized protein n=1 Tax=Streptantibioticus parmotrematis TaxID=2873249 RepID=A0ABS7QP23_9ACTN|nr:hypothetical protein [Streptantibioticus parmotrematis]MBY8883559.1 hypothetical protein [Streptantibioticus parmotrematis]
MSKTPKRSHPPHGEGPSQHKGTDQHGWSPDVDAERQQDNPSAHRSFHADQYAPDADETQRADPAERERARKQSTEPSSRTGESQTKSGEEHARRSGQKGHRDTGTRGRSQRPSGTKDASAYTGVDPQDESGKGDDR